MAKYEFMELTFRQICDKDFNGLFGEVYGDEFRTKKDFSSTRVDWAKAWDYFEKTMTAVGLNGWELVSVTKFPLHLGQEIHILQTFYFQRPVTG